MTIKELIRQYRDKERNPHSGVRSHYPDKMICGEVEPSKPGLLSIKSVLVCKAHFGSRWDFEVDERMGRLVVLNEFPTDEELEPFLNAQSNNP